MPGGHMGYKKPILNEIYSEVFLSGDGLGTSFIDLVSSFKEFGLTEVELAPIRQFHVSAPSNPANNDDPKVTRDILPRVRVWSGDRKKLAQLSKSQFVVNLIQPYPGWEEFKNLFNKVLTTAQAKYPKIKVDSIVLFSIDRVSLPASDFKLGRYFNTDGDFIPKWYTDCATAADIILGKGIAKNDGFNQQIQLKIVPMGTHFDVVLHTKLHRSVVSTDKVQEVLEALHKESVACFEGLITDVTRNQIMGGLK